MYHPCSKFNRGQMHRSMPEPACGRQSNKSGLSSCTVLILNNGINDSAISITELESSYHSNCLVLQYRKIMNSCL